MEVDGLEGDVAEDDVEYAIGTGWFQGDLLAA